MRGLLLKISATLLVAGFAATAAAPGVRAANVQAGGDLARYECDGCHVVAANQEIPPLVKNTAPSFFAIANRPDTSAQSLEAFLSRPHPYSNMPFPDLRPADVANVAAFLMSLRGRH